MHPRSRRTLALWALLWVSGPTLATGEDAAVALVARMAEATRTLNYDGVFVYQRGNQTDTFRIIHSRDERGGERERLISLSGAAREIIRDSEKVTCIDPEDQSVMVEKSQPRNLFPGLTRPTEEVAKHYRFVQTGRDRIAGRPAEVVEIRPRSAYRYGYRFWIDAGNHMLLRSDVVNSHGVSLEQIMFTQISHPDRIAEDLLVQDIPAATSPAAPAAVKSRAAAADETMEAWRVAWVPDGFALRDRQMEQLSASQVPAERFVYSDGLATVSVFVERLMDGEVPMQGFATRGAVTAFSSVADAHQITVIGEVPPLTLKQIAMSVEPAESR
jgi:sigma-E factor negative regulatory protein RseB